MTEFLNTETHTQVLLMDHFWSLRLREVRIWVNTVFVLISRNTEIARSVRGPKLQGPRAEDALAEPYLVQKIFGDLITADHKVLRGLGYPMDLVISVQNKNFSGNTKELAKVLGA